MVTVRERTHQRTNPKRATEGDHEIKRVEFVQNAYNGEELTANDLKNENIIQTMSEVMGFRARGAF